MEVHPHFTRWLTEQRALICQAGQQYPSLPLAATDVEQPVPTKINKIDSVSQEAKPMFEQVSQIVEDQKQAQEPQTPQTKVRKPRQPRQPRQPAALAPTINGAVALTPEQTSKLWQVITGGKLAIAVENGHLVCQVSLDSFNKALPVLLERL